MARFSNGHAILNFLLKFNAVFSRNSFNPQASSVKKEHVDLDQASVDGSRRLEHSLGRRREGGRVNSGPPIRRDIWKYIVPVRKTSRNHHRMRHERKVCSYELGQR